jgi:release factor glutamine methyltransferase
MTVAEALRQATARLREAGVDSPDHDSEVLLRHALGWERARLLVESATPLSPQAESSFLDRVAERAGRRPLQHITGEQWFWRHAFRVTADVLVPRPETELIVEEALRRLAGRASPLVVDVGTGSGCIALSLAAERPDAEVWAIDLSPAALEVARENASRLGLTGRVRLVAGDLLDPVRALTGRVDLVASNPPYVDPASAPGLAPEVRLFEPAIALFPPGEPYHVYRRLVPQAAAALRPGGAMLLEVGQGMAEEVARIVERAGFRMDRVIPDLQGIPRTVVALAPGIATSPFPAVD